MVRTRARAGSEFVCPLLGVLRELVRPNEGREGSVSVDCCADGIVRCRHAHETTRLYVHAGHARYARHPEDPRHACAGAGSTACSSSAARATVAQGRAARAAGARGRTARASDAHGSTAAGEPGCTALTAGRAIAHLEWHHHARSAG